MDPLSDYQKDIQRCEKIKGQHICYWLMATLSFEIKRMCFNERKCIVNLMSVLPVLLTCVGLTMGNCTNEDVYRSTDEWKDLVIGKCLLYLNEFDHKLFCNSNINCTELWLQVKKAVKNQTKCNFSTNNYQDFVVSSQHYVPPNKFLFWEGVYPFVMRYSNKGKRFYTIADTLTGYIFDSMDWCGNSTESDGIEKYPRSCRLHHGPDCPQSAQSAFWATASTNYARHANGEIHVMMNASRSHAFREDSFFGSVELVNINSTKVRKAKVLMVHYPSDAVLETCDSPSIQALMTKFVEKDIQTECIDNPRDAQLLMCSDEPDIGNCKSLVSFSSSPRMTLPFLLFLILPYFC